MFQITFPNIKQNIIKPVGRLLRSTTPSLIARSCGYFILTETITLLANHFSVSSDVINSIINTLGGGSTTLGWIALTSLELALSSGLAISSYVASNQIFKTTIPTNACTNSRLKSWLYSSHDYLRRSMITGGQFSICWLLANSRFWIADANQMLNIYNSISWYGCAAITILSCFIPGFITTWIHKQLCKRDYSLRQSANVGALLTSIVTSLLFLAISPEHANNNIMIISAIAIPLTHLTGGVLTFIASKTHTKTRNFLLQHSRPLTHIKNKVEPGHLKIMQLLGNHYLLKSTQTIIETLMTTLVGYRFGLTVSEIGYVKNPEQIEPIYEEYRQLRWLTLISMLLLYYGGRTHLGFGDRRPAIIREVNSEQLPLITNDIEQPFININADEPSLSQQNKTRILFI